MSEVVQSYLRLAALDCANGGGTCTVTLRGGTRLTGRVRKQLTTRDVLHLNTATGGWHVVDWGEVAALTGEPEGEAR